MKLVELCKLLGLKYAGYQIEVEYWQIEQDLFYIGYSSLEVEFSHDIKVYLHKGLLPKTLLDKVRTPDTKEEITKAVNKIAWEMAAEEFKEKLSKVIEFGGKL